MTSKIDKFLSKLDAERQEKVIVALLRMRSGDFGNLDIKKLKGFASTYRVRIGQCRITFEKNHIGVNIIDIDFKNDNTYRK